MGFTSPEYSIQSGRPVETYRFLTTAGVGYNFTNAETEVTDTDGITYTPAAVSRTQPRQSQEKRATEITVTLPYGDSATTEFAATFVSQPPEGRTELTIQRTHLSDAGEEFVVFWQGRVISAAFSARGEIELLCRGLKNIFEREGPRMRWGGMCNHVLYDTNCGLLAVNFTDSNVTVDAVSSNGVEVTVSGLSSPIKDFVGGKMAKDGGADYRLIVAQSGNVLTLQYPFLPDFGAGDTVSLEQGCDHTLTGDCSNKFSNTTNFGGTPYTPGLNPFSDGLDTL